MLKWPQKDPQEVLDYTIDWADALGADTIVTSSFTVDDLESGLVINSFSNNNSQSIVWLSGGNLNTTGIVTCTITTAGGRTRQASAQLKIKSTGV